jgi:hypothetical protein
MVKVEAEVPSLLLLTNQKTSTVPTLPEKKVAALKRLLRMKAVIAISGYKTVNLAGKELLTQEERTMSQTLIFSCRKSI